MFQCTKLAENSTGPYGPVPYWMQWSVQKASGPYQNVPTVKKKQWSRQVYKKLNFITDTEILHPRFYKVILIDTYPLYQLLYTTVHLSETLEIMT